MKYRIDDYTYQGLVYPIDNPSHQPGPSRSLCYLVGLVNSQDHKISEVLPAKRIISWLYSCEEQSINAEHLKEGETFFERYFVGGYYPKTPCMIVNQWSPISAMLERGFDPVILCREPKFRAVATGLWTPPVFSQILEIESAKTDEELFWAIIMKVSHLATERSMWINIIAQPGWDYDAAIHSLPNWTEGDVENAGRILWERTPAG